jgi:hypothetical protein
MGDLLPRAAVALLLLLLSSSSPKPVAGTRPSLGAVGRRYDSIFSFGDSYTDTGNNPVAFAWYDVTDPVMRPPYGSTFFGRPTGRCCDGRLVIDFIGACSARGHVCSAHPVLSHSICDSMSDVCSVVL